MWYFQSPEVVFGEGAVGRLGELIGERAFLVTDETMQRLGFVEMVRQELQSAGMESAVFAGVEPDPSLETVRDCAAAMTEYGPDWVIGLGGGSCIDAAKGAWLLYECPEADPAGINPFESFGVGAKAKMAAIPTTSGTGAEATYALVLTDHAECRKLGLGSRELVPNLAIVDPVFVRGLPPQLTADTGMDALTHAIEGYSSTWRNDFSDGLCLKAVELVFSYLERACDDGSDMEARTHLHNAATIAGLGFGNSMAALAHAMGHSLGAVLHIPHGRSVGLFLAYTIQFVGREGGGRYADIAHCLHLPAADERQGAASLVSAIGKLQSAVGFPRSLGELGIGEEAFSAALPKLVANAETDTSLIASARIPSSDELERLFRYTYGGRPIDF